MKYRKLILFFLLVFNHSLIFAQCEYTLDNYSHNDCIGTNYGSIDITISNPNATATWGGPNGFFASGTALSNLYAGAYYLTITNTIQVCTLIDSIQIEEAIRISREFDLTGRCSDEDSVNVITNLWGGTPPYTTIWSNGIACSIIFVYTIE